MKIKTQRLLLHVPSANDAQKLYNYYRKNLPYLKKWFVDQPAGAYELEILKDHLSRCEQKFNEEKEVKFFICKNEQPDLLTGELTFSNILKGGFLSCYAGYHLDEHQQGKGIMTEALIAGTDFIFRKLKLHRIEANIMPANFASQKVATKAGFYKEGISARYLKINGCWEDHLRYVIFNPAME